MAVVILIILSTENVTTRYDNMSCIVTQIRLFPVIILSFRTDRSGQTVQTQIRLLLEEQSDQGLHCLLFHLQLLKKYPKVWPLCLNFR